MGLQALYDTPSWEWPQGAEELILRVLRDNGADKSDRLLAAEMAGDSVVVNDELADVLLSVLADGKAPDDLRSRAAISLGPALEYADIEWDEDRGGFDDPSAVPVSEQTFREILKTLHNTYMDAATPRHVRRRVLEAAVRAPQKWQQNVIREAYSSGDADWKLTAVFCMRYVRGFDKEILDSLTSKNEDVHYEAVCAAGNWEIDAAWPHVAGLLNAAETGKRLLLAAVEAAAIIRPNAAPELLYNLMDSGDEDIVAAINEALAMTGDGWEAEDGDYEDDQW
ncbi:MAG: hypothetical protein P8Y74_01195 [Desulfobacterales bacterium]